MSLHGVAVTATGAERLRARHPQLPLSDLAAAAPRWSRAGRCGCSSPDGEALGDRRRRSRERAGARVARGRRRHRQGHRRRLGDPRVRRRASSARTCGARWRCAAALGLADGVSAYRLVNGEGDGLSGLAVDVYGPYAVVTRAVARAAGPRARAGRRGAGGAARGRSAAARRRPQGPPQSAGRQPRARQGPGAGRGAAGQADRARERRALRGAPARRHQRRPVLRHARSPRRAGALRARPPRAEHVRVHRRAVAGRGARRRRRRHQRRSRGRPAGVGARELPPLGPRSRGGAVSLGGVGRIPFPGHRARARRDATT